MSETNTPPTEEICVNLEKIKPINSVAIDVREFDKKEVKIERAKVIKVNSNYTKTGKQWVLKVESEPVISIGDDEDKIEIRASELFNLIQDDDGNLLGFPTNENSNLMKFVKDLGVKNPESMESIKPLVEAIKGKKAIIKAYEKETESGKKYFLKFRY